MEITSLKASGLSAKYTRLSYPVNFGAIFAKQRVFNSGYKKKSEGYWISLIVWILPTLTTPKIFLKA